jgi:hypothetical protein
MAKNPASYQKRQREMDKKRKAEDKRKRRLTQKLTPDEPVVSRDPREGDPDFMGESNPTAR